MRLRTFIRTTFPDALPTAGVSSVETELLAHGYVVVRDGDDILGILTPEGVVEKGHLLVMDCMRVVPSLSVAQDAWQALETMRHGNFRAMPVFQEHRFAGVVARTDLESASSEFRAELEQSVTDRTEELQTEITVRKRAEEALHASLREKDILISEIQHRVKNNLQVISGLLALQARASKNPELIESFHKSQDRIQAMALVHEKLYNSNDFSRIDLAGYARSLSEELFQSHNIHPGKIDLAIQTNGEVYVDITKAIPCGLILNELISNALKHAFPGDGSGKLQIIIGETKDTEIEIVVRDNGVGLPDDFDIHESRSVGLHLINGLVENQLDGQIEVIRDNGTEFRITFPL